MVNYSKFVLSPLKIFLFFSVCSTVNLQIANASVSDIEFNVDVLDANDRGNIDLSQFSNPGYLMPGEYELAVYVNKQSLQETSIFYYESPDNPNESLPCLNHDFINKFGLKPEYLKSLTWWRDGQCLAFSSLPGIKTKADLSKSILYISIPQAYLEYVSENWDPPARWEDGISGVLLDYNLNSQISQQIRSRHTSNYNISGNGVTGFNLGVWRFRADWQGRLDKREGERTTKSFDWNRYYAYRALKNIGAKLTLGEDYLLSDIFDSFQFIGLSLVTDSNMLPPNLRGYAPEVTGVAKNNATVIISQQGHVIYQTQVAAGPFRIQDLNDAISGQLDVRVEEQDGSVQVYTINTATIPYLTRPGQLRYKIATGRPIDSNHHVSGNIFSTGEFSWGVNNGWSLYGGGVASQHYLSTAIGFGRDLMRFGALSFDITHSRAKINGVAHLDGKTYRGNSYRLSYSKHFDDYNSQVTFAGYRFSEKDFMSMSEYLDAKISGEHLSNSKELYTISYNQSFPDLKLSAYLNFSHQTYWNRPDNDRYSLSLSRYFDVGKYKNLSLNVTAYRNRYNKINDDGIYASLSIPWSNGGTLIANSNWAKHDNTQSISYNNTIDERNNYQLTTGWARSGALISGNYNYKGNSVKLSTNATYQQDRYRSAGLSLRGGITATKNGVALHRSNQLGGTRIFVDTEGVADIPIRGYGTIVRTNHFGKAVITDVNSYYRNRLSIDLNALPDGVDTEKSIKQGTLTEGAIGYRKFKAITGASAMATLRLDDNMSPPFGAIILNDQKRQVGIVGDDGSSYISGLNPNSILQVVWDGTAQCKVQLPESLPNEQGSLSNGWLLPCVKI